MVRLNPGHAPLVEALTHLLARDFDNALLERGFLLHQTSATTIEAQIRTRLGTRYFKITVEETK